MLSAVAAETVEKAAEVPRAGGGGGGGGRWRGGGGERAVSGVRRLVSQEPTEGNCAWGRGGGDRRGGRLATVYNTGALVRAVLLHAGSFPRTWNPSSCEAGDEIR